MFNNDNRKTYEFYEDYEDNETGRAMLKMPWLWDDGEYPQRKNATVPAMNTTPAVQTAETSGVVKPQPDPFMQQAKPGSMSDAFKTPALLPGSQSLYGQASADTYFEDFTKNYDSERALNESLEMLKKLKPKPYSRSLAAQPDLAQPVKSTVPVSEQTPYKDMGQLAKPASDKIIKNFVEPAAQKLVQAVRDKEPVEHFPEKATGEDYQPVKEALFQAAKAKQPVELFPETVTGDNWTPIKDRPNVVATPEGDMLNTSKPVSDALRNAYTEENVTHAINAIHAGATLGHKYDMTNPNDDFLKGMEYTSRENEVSQRAAQQVFNKIFSPEGVHTKELDAWMKKEEAWLEANPLPELRDFSKIDWERHPDKVLELGSKYFRQTFLGSHAYGLALSMMDSPGKKGNPLLNQQIEGTLSGMARIYCAKDEILQAAVQFGKKDAAAGWDFMVNKATGKLPLVSSEGLRLLNRFLTKEQKEAMFYKMTEGVIADDEIRAGTTANRQKQEPPAILSIKPLYPFKK